MILGLPAVLVFAAPLVFELRFDFFAAPNLAFADARAELGDFTRPRFGFHRFRPEGPGSALCGTALINGAALVLQKHAIAFRRIRELPDSVLLIAIFLGELARRKIHDFGHSPAIFERHINVAVTTARNAAVAAALTLKLYSIVPKILLHLNDYLRVSGLRPSRLLPNTSLDRLAHTYKRRTRRWPLSARIFSSPSLRALRRSPSLPEVART